MSHDLWYNYWGQVNPTTLDYELKDAYRAAVLTLDGLDLFGNRDPRNVDDVITITILVTNIDEIGSVALSTTTPGALKPITATLTDPDTLIYEGMPSYNRWVWQSSADGAIWMNISEATTQTASVEMVPSAELVGQMLRIGVQYDDGHGRGKSAMSITTAPVNAAPPLPVNNAPVFLRGEYANLSVPENTAEGESIDPAFVHHATDSDEGDTLTYTLGGADAGLFDIDRGTGEITVGAGTMLDYEDPNNADHEYEVTVKATDPSDASDTITVTILVTDVRVSVDPVVNGYDANTNEMIDKGEILQAVADYFNDEIEKGAILELVRLYFDQ